MFNRVAVYITKCMLNNKIIPADKMVVVEWGIRNILDTLFNVVSFFIIGIVLHMITETIIFTICYIPLRSYAGGFHANTPFRCWIISNFILFISMMLISYFQKVKLDLFLLPILSVCILFFFMPVSDIHKPLEKADKKKYKKKGCLILIFEIIIAILFYIINLKNVTYCLFSVWIVLSVMLIVGKIKNYINSYTL